MVKYLLAVLEIGIKLTIICKFWRIFMRDKILESFFAKFGESDFTPNVFFSPGRVNLIGEHIDYNGGYVFPCAIDLGTYGVMRPRADNIIKLASGNFDKNVEFSTENLVVDPGHEWGNYVKGVIVQFEKAGHKIGGFDLYVYGNLPNGAGLSSSASLNALVAIAINTVFDLGIDPIERSKMCRYAEHFNGVNCGIMDPFACTMGKDDNAILLNCDTLEYSYAPLNLGDYRILISNTNYKRGLADSKYNERLVECEHALNELKKVCDINELCDLTPEEFEKHKHVIENDTYRKRAEHAVYENYRTKACAQALTEGRLHDIYDYMKDSHTSLRDLYDVVGEPLDTLVQATLKYAQEHDNAILGSRMTGAGFGGCTVSIVHKDSANDIIAVVSKEYAEKLGANASFYLVNASDGAREI